jgi:hypothetical protein
MLDALMYFLKPIKPSRLTGPTTAEFALQYFSKRPKERDEVVALLAQYGITLAVVQAKAIELGEKPCT